MTVRTMHRSRGTAAAAAMVLMVLAAGCGDTIYDPERATRVRSTAARDYLRIVGDMARAISDGRPAYAHARFALHVTEVTLAAHYATHPVGAPLGYGAGRYRPETTFEPLEPPAWAT